MSRIISQTSEKGWLKNLTIANSNWTKDILNKEFGLDCEVLHPPVWGSFRRIPWAERANGFVVLGRFSPEKQIERVISILRRTRERGHDLHLHILGRGDNLAYAKFLSDLSRTHRDWVFLEGLVVGERKNALLAEHRYGISGCRNEAYGIAVAEMVKSGAIVWVPAGGGQVEIVGQKELIYDSDEDAIEKICRVLGAETEQQRLRNSLEMKSRSISHEGFVDGARAIVAKSLRENAGH